MVEKCHTCGIKNVFISSLVYTTRIGLPVLERTHEMIVHLCNKLGICYVDNRNIRRKHLWKDDLHLVESGKAILAKQKNLKVGLSPSKKVFGICLFQSPLKAMKHLKNSSRSQGIEVFVGLIRKIRLTSKFMTSQPGLQTFAIHILSNIS